MKKTIFVLLATGLLLVGCGDKEKADSPPVNTRETSMDPNPQSVMVNTNEPVVAESPQTTPTNKPETPVKSGRRPARTQEAVVLEKAIQLFNVQERRYPLDLEELVTKGYVNALPDNPPGGRFIYNPTNGQLLLVRD